MNADVKRIQQHLEVLAEHTATPGQGITRMSYSKEDVLSRNYLKQQMASIGLSVREDAIGNIYGRFEGSEANLPPVMIGSHFDSVPNGGAFDGPAGVIMGLEIASLFYQYQLKPRYPLEIVALVEEEGASFGGGLLASRAIAGYVSADDLHAMFDSDGVSAAEKMARLGFNADNVASVVRKSGDIRAFIELHIEQGPVLEQSNSDVGIVDTIVGLSQLIVTINGKAGHAGTTPMDMRADALLVTSELIGKIAQFAIVQGETVATVGKLQVFPNGANIIPSKVTFTVDIRSKNEQKLNNVLEQVTQAVNDIASAQFTVNIEQPIYIKPTHLDSSIVKLLECSAAQLDYKNQKMVSGAGHDAMIFANICPVGLVFVPSRNGLSHHPDEWTDYEQIKKGIDVIFEAVKVLTEVKE